MPFTWPMTYGYSKAIYREGQAETGRQTERQRDRDHLRTGHTVNYRNVEIAAGTNPGTCTYVRAAIRNRVHFPGMRACITILPSYVIKLS